MKYHLLVILIALVSTLSFAQSPEDLIHIVDDETAVYAIKTLDGGYALTGNINSAGGAYPFFAKLNEQKELLWIKNFHEIQICRSFDVGSKFVELPDSSFLLAECGYNSQTLSYDVVLYRIDKNGELRWSRFFEKAKDQRASIIVKTNYNDYVIVGSHTKESNSRELLIMSVNENGDIQWEKTIPPPVQSTLAYPTELKETSSGEIYIAWDIRDTRSTGVLTKLSTNKEVQWQNLIQSTYNITSFGMTLTSDEQVAICGDGNRQGFIKKFDPDGNLLFESYSKKYRYAYFYDVLNINNHLVAIGFATDPVSYQISQDDFWMFITDQQGNIVLDTIWGTEGRNEFYSATPINDKLYLLAGTSFNGIDNDIYLTSFDFSFLQTTSQNSKKELAFLQVYPNPTQDLLYIKAIGNIQSLFIKSTLQIYSTDGRLILSETINSLPFTVNISSYLSGFYTILIKNNAEIVYRGKLIKS